MRLNVKTWKWGRIVGATLISATLLTTCALFLSGGMAEHRILAKLSYGSCLLYAESAGGGFLANPYQLLVWKHNKLPWFGTHTVAMVSNTTRFARITKLTDQIVCYAPTQNGGEGFSLCLNLRSVPKRCLDLDEYGKPPSTLEAELVLPTSSPLCYVCQPREPQGPAMISVDRPPATMGRFLIVLSADSLHARTVEDSLLSVDVYWSNGERTLDLRLNPSAPRIGIKTEPGDNQ